MSLVGLGCGTEAPTPELAPVLVESATPSIPPSRIKFDVGAMPSSGPQIDPAVAIELHERLASAEAAGIPLRSFETVQRFYEQRDERPAWIVARRISALGVDALRGLGQLPAHGLDPARYGTDALAPTGPEPDDPVGFELLLTDAWLTAAAHLGWGRVDPETMRGSWTADGRADGLVEALEAALADGNPREAMLALAPSHAEYTALVTALDGLHQQAKKGEPAEAIEQLVAQVPADQERLRWLPRELGARHVRIDQGSGRLTMVDGTKTGPAMRVAVSRRCGALDSLSTTITHVVIHPRDRSHGAYEVRGAEQGVTLHGAAADVPFPEGGVVRAGCLRIEAPQELAMALLGGDPGWTGDATIGPEGPQQVIELAEPVPLHLTRSSVIIDDRGVPALREGAYARDASLRAALAKGPEPVRSLPPKRSNPHAQPERPTLSPSDQP